MAGHASLASEEAWSRAVVDQRGSNGRQRGPSGPAALCCSHVCGEALPVLACTLSRHSIPTRPELPAAFVTAHCGALRAMQSAVLAGLYACGHPITCGAALDADHWWRSTPPRLKALGLAGTSISQLCFSCIDGTGGGQLTCRGGDPPCRRRTQPPWEIYEASSTPSNEVDI